VPGSRQSNGSTRHDLVLLQVAVEKSRGNTSGAIESLRKYLDTYQNDKEAWEELAELYLEVGVRMLHHATAVDLLA
jgi:hypothetical protein